jgi:anaerobic selenocysteine-containing dehydrogenase
MIQSAMMGDGCGSIAGLSSTNIHITATPRNDFMGHFFEEEAISRRELMKGVVRDAASAGLLASCMTASSPVHEAPHFQQSDYDFTRQSGALQPDRIVDSACQFCNSLCRLKVHLKDQRIIDVRGEPDDPVQAGGLCVKASLMTQLVYNRYRLRQPCRRVAGEKGSSDSKFEPISWDEALQTIASRFLDLRDKGEARAIANKTSGPRRGHARQSILLPSWQSQ